MRINGSNPLENFAVADLAASKARAAKTNDAPAASKAAPEGQTQSLILQALSAHDFRPEAVEEARRLMESGELESPESIMRAAEKLLDLGI